MAHKKFSRLWFPGPYTQVRVRGMSGEGFWPKCDFPFGTDCLPLLSENEGDPKPLPSQSKSWVHSNALEHPIQTITSCQNQQSDCLMWVCCKIVTACPHLAADLLYDCRIQTYSQLNHFCPALSPYAVNLNSLLAQHARTVPSHWCEDSNHKLATFCAITYRGGASTFFPTIISRDAC